MYKQIFTKIMFVILSISMGAQASWYDNFTPTLTTFPLIYSSLLTACDIARDKIVSAVQHPAAGWMAAGTAACVGLYAYHRTAKKFNSLRMELDSAKSLNKKYEENLKIIETGYRSNIFIYQLVIDQQNAILKSQELFEKKDAQQDAAYKTLMADTKIIIENKKANSPRV